MRFKIRILYVCLCIGRCACVCRLEVQIRCLFHCSLHIVRVCQGLSLNMEISHWCDWLISKL